MFRQLAIYALFPLVSAVFSAAASAQIIRSCAAEAGAVLQSLSLDNDAVASIRYERKLNPTENGPAVLGVRAWVRLNSCSGFLIIDMTRSCFVRQSYTRGDCVVEGITRY